MSWIITCIKRIFLKIKFARKKVKIANGTRIAINSYFEGCNKIGAGSLFAGRMGYASYMGENCAITAEIGRFCSIASRVVTVRGSHPIKQWVSTHPAFFSTQKQCGMTFVTEDKFIENKPPIHIGNDVWIGDSALLMDGVTIGDGAIIAAGAVVTKDVEPYTIVGGVPAKPIKSRFSDEQIAQLLELRWWEKPEAWLQEHAFKFGDVETFFEG